MEAYKKRKVEMSEISPRFKVGDKCGRLTVIKYLGRYRVSKNTSSKVHQYMMQCECGEKRQCNQQRLTQTRYPAIECVSCAKQKVSDRWHQFDRSRKEKEEAPEYPEMASAAISNSIVNSYWRPTGENA